MYGCEVFIQAKQLQRTLNTRKKKYLRENPSDKRMVLPNNMILHPKPRNVIENSLGLYTSLSECFVIVICSISNLILIITFFNNQTITDTLFKSTKPMEIWVKSYNYCPKYKMASVESNESIDSPRINFISMKYSQYILNMVL